MNLREAAERALDALEDIFGKEKKDVGAINALRQALNETPPCKTHPDAPHGFDRNASHGADRYVCECEGWEPPEREYVTEVVAMHENGTRTIKQTLIQKREWVGLSDDEREHFRKLGFVGVLAVEAKLKEKNA